MKVCTLYGEGFYYIPGTQTCIKIGGFLRTEIDFHAGGSFTPFFATNALQTRANDAATTRARGVITMDTREQTSFGTLRSYIAAGWQQTSNDAPTLSLPGTAVGSAGGAANPSNTNNSSTYLLRAFIQWGGFTFGKTASFYDFFNTSKYSHQTNFIYQDYAGVGVFTYGYTQQLGNGVAATIALQDNTTFAHPVLDVSNTTAAGTVFAPGVVGTFAADNPFQVGAGGPTNSGFTNAGFLVPDVVGNVRVDQAWGGAQIAAILHDNRSSAYLNPGNGIIDTTAHPSDRWGFGISGGVELNLQNWGWAKGDSFSVQSQYCVGDSESCVNNSGSRAADLFWGRKSGGKIGLAWADDAYFANNTSNGVQTGLQLPTAWNIWAAVQHYWTPELRTSLYGGYLEYHANSSAVDASFCAPLHAGATINNGGGNTLVGSSAVSASGCADWATWAIGSRTIWNPTKNLDIGVDVLYSALTKSAFQGATLVFTPAQSPKEILTAGSSNIVAGIVRVQYNFNP